MAAYLEKTVLIEHNIFLQPYRANDGDYKAFKTDVEKQLSFEPKLLFNKSSGPNSLNTLIKTYKLIRDGLYLNKAQQVSLDYKDDQGQIKTKAIYLTKDEYLKLKTLSSLETQDKTIKSYQRLQDLITENETILKDNKFTDFFTFELYRDRVLGLFDTFEGDFPDKADKILKGYQKSYEEALEVLEDLVTSRNPLRSGFYRMYNQSPAVRQTVDAFKRALVEKAAIEENEHTEFKTMELGLMKLLQYGSLDERLRKQILALIQQNAERIKMIGGEREKNYAAELQGLLDERFGFTTVDQIQKPTISTLGESIQSGWSKLTSIFKGKETEGSVVKTDYLKQLESDLIALSEEVNKIIPALNPAIPADELKLKMYEELLANLELLLGLIMDIKQVPLSKGSQVKLLYENLQQALQNVINETRDLNQSSQEMVEILGNAITPLIDIDVKAPEPEPEVPEPPPPGPQVLPDQEQATKLRTEVIDKYKILQTFFTNISPYIKKTEPFNKFKTRIDTTLLTNIARVNSIFDSNQYSTAIKEYTQIRNHLNMILENLRKFYIEKIITPRYNQLKPIIDKLPEDIDETTKETLEYATQLYNNIISPDATVDSIYTFGNEIIGIYDQYINKVLPSSQPLVETPELPEAEPELPEAEPELIPRPPQGLPPVFQRRNLLPPLSPLQPLPELPEAGPELPEAGPELPEAGPELPEAEPELPEAGPELPEAGLELPEAEVMRQLMDEYTSSDAIDVKGIPNKDATCYLNSTIQLLIRSDIFRNNLFKYLGSDEFIKGYQSAFKNYLEKEILKKDDIPDICKLKTSVRTGQEDPVEVINELINKLPDGLKPSPNTGKTECYTPDTYITISPSCSFEDADIDSKVNDELFVSFVGMQRLQNTTIIQTFNTLTNYTLKGFIVRTGRVTDIGGTSGHIIAYVKKGDNWYRCNDSEITKISKFESDDRFEDRKICVALLKRNQESRPETPLPPPGRPYTASLAFGPPAPVGFDIVNPISEPSTKKQVQESIIKFLREQASLENVFSHTDSKFTITELNKIITKLPKDGTSEATDKKKANLIRIAFFVANIQESAETADLDMSGLTKYYFEKMLDYFKKSRNPDYAKDDAYKQIQIDLYCILVDQLYALHNKKPSATPTYADLNTRSNFKQFIDIDKERKGYTYSILLDTILPQFKRDEETYKPAYIPKSSDILDDIPELKDAFNNLKKTDNPKNRQDFIVNFIKYLTTLKYRNLKSITEYEKKQIIYALLVGSDEYGQYANLSSSGGDINLSEENKDMDGGAGKDETANPLENIKQAIEKLDEYRKALRITQEELNSWKEKFTNYDKSVDITKDFKPVELPDRETIQIIRAFHDDLLEAYNAVKQARDEEKRINAEGELAVKKLNDTINSLTEQRRNGKTEAERREFDKPIQAAQRDLRNLTSSTDKNNEEAAAASVAAEKEFTDQLKTFLVSRFAYDETAKKEQPIREFVNKLKKVLGQISDASLEINALSNQLLSITDLMTKIDEKSKGGNYYTATEIVSIYEFLKGKAADLKKFNTERFNAMDKKIREVYQFILTTNKPLEKKEKFKLKRLEFEALLDGSENTGIQQTLNIFDDQRFKDLIVVDKTKKSIKGLLPTIKDIKRLMETDIDYFTSLFQQKTTSILKQQELERQQQELQVRRAQPQQGPIAFYAPQQKQEIMRQGGEQGGGAEIDTETRKKLKYYFGIDKEPTEEYEAYKNVQLYLDVFNKLIDSYKFSLTTITDPAAALALSGDKSLFNMIYEKYLKSAEDETKGSFIASQELSTALDTNNLLPRKVLRVTLRDKIIILFTTLFMRLITLSIVEFMIEKGVLKNLKFTMLAYLGFFSILFIAFTALINLDLYRLRIVFNYLNFHANADKVYSYLLLLWAFGGIIYYIIANINPDITITNTSEDVKARLIYRIQVLSLIIWLFLMIMIFIF